MKKGIFVSFAALVLCSGVILLSCGKANGTAAAPGADPYDNLPMEVSVIVLDRGAVPASEGSYEDNRWTRWANEHAPVKITYVPVNRGQSYQLIYALFAAGNAPDIAWEYSKGFMDTLYDQGVIMPLDDLIEKYSTTYKQFQKDNPILLPYLRAEDGKQYGVTSFRKMVPAPWGGLWIRQDWLDKFGMMPPKTTDEVVTYMRRVRDEDPDGNGQKDTFGIGGLVNPDYFLANLRSLFGAPDSNFLIENGHYLDWTETAGYRDFLDFVAMVYREGFIDQEFITDSQSTRQKQLFITGKTGLYLATQSITSTDLTDIRKNVPSVGIVPLEPWATSQGKFGLYTDPVWMKMVCVNKGAKNPKAVMAFLDWSLSEEAWMTMTYGLEGVHYQLVDGVPQSIDADKNRIETAYLNGNTEFLPLTMVTEKPEWYPIMAAKDPISQESARMRQRQAEFASKYLYRRVVPYGPTSEALRQFGADTGAQIAAIETDIYTGKVSVEAGLKQINDLKKSAGWDAIKAEKDAWLQANKKNFGM